MNTSSFNQSLVDVIRSYGLLQDRMPGDQLTLPNQWIDIKLNENDLILSDTINYSLEALHKNWLYLLAYSVIPTNDIPDIQLYTHVIMDKGTGISWVNSANDYASRNSEIGGIKNIIKIQNTAVPDNYNIIAATTTNLMMLSGNQTSSINFIENWDTAMYDENGDVIPGTVTRSDSSITHPSNGIYFQNIKDLVVTEQKDLFVLDTHHKIIFKFDISGATTLDEYQKYFEKDKALERRFQKVMVDQPNREAAISILRGIKEKYETHHEVRIKDEAIIAAVDLSTRYISDRFLPDKAIDLIDEAASKIRMEINSKPEELDDLDRKITQIEIEIQAIKKEKDEQKTSDLNAELTEIKEKRTLLFTKWSKEREVIDQIQNTKKELEKLKTEAEKAQREGDYEKVAKIRYGTSKELEEKLKTLQVEVERNQEQNIIKEEVNSEDIAEIVSKWTGIPVHKLMSSEIEKLLHLEAHLGKTLIGQNNAVEVVSEAIRRNKAGLNATDKPIGSFLFIGPTGVGKTELSKALASYLFNDKNAITRIDMSEYQEKHSVSRLIGAPPGYVGYDEGGQLTEAVRRRPYSIVLLDEIEKAHPDTFNILLQVLDEGHLTDSQGRWIDFKNTIVIMTSNIGASHWTALSEEDLFDMQQIEEIQYKVLEELKQRVKPEFLNRIDEITLFTPLKPDDISKITSLQLNELAHTLKEKGIAMQFTDEAVSYLSQQGYDIHYGARPLKRVIQREVLSPLSKKILSGDIKSKGALILDNFDNRLVFRTQILT